ncbi:MAG: hypothetical protein JXB34_00640 [Bacteroidales bacterium]|nr:hypothetical protein [Bacteroidales bacterium]
MRKILILLLLAIFTLSTCATSKHTRELKRKSRDCGCEKIHKSDRNTHKR